MKKLSWAFRLAVIATVLLVTGCSSLGVSNNYQRYSDEMIEFSYPEGWKAKVQQEGSVGQTAVYLNGPVSGYFQIVVYPENGDLLTIDDYKEVMRDKFAEGALRAGFATGGMELKQKYKKIDEQYVEGFLLTSDVSKADKISKLAAQVFKLVRGGVGVMFISEAPSEEALKGVELVYSSFKLK